MKSEGIPGGDELVGLRDELGSSFLHDGRPVPSDEEAAEMGALVNEGEEI
jgi:hypothetical protein